MAVPSMFVAVVLMFEADVCMFVAVVSLVTMLLSPVFTDARVRLADPVRALTKPSTVCACGFWVWLCAF